MSTFLTVYQNLSKQMLAFRHVHVTPYGSEMQPQLSRLFWHILKRGGSTQACPWLNET